jgi:hypothetical protein
VGERDAARGRALDPVTAVWATLTTRSRWAQLVSVSAHAQRRSTHLTARGGGLQINVSSPGFAISFPSTALREQAKRVFVIELDRQVAALEKK